jgi:hypothetical protein
MTQETDIQTKIIKALKQRYLGAVIFKHSEQVLCGVPDIYFGWKGLSFFFEVKTPHGKISDIQAYTLAKLTDQGIHAHVVYDSAQAIKIVDMALMQRAEGRLERGKNLFNKIRKERG